MSFETNQPKGEKSMSMERSRPTTSAALVNDRFDQSEGDGAMKLPSLAQLKRKLTTKEGWIGDYAVSYVCLNYPFPFIEDRRNVEQGHAHSIIDHLWMATRFGNVGGLITPPIIFANQLGFNPAQQNQAVAVSLIASGILSAIQMSRFAIPFTNRKYWLGTGLITVVGTSFATLSTGSAIFNTLYLDGTCPSTVANGVTTRGYCPEAYGYLLGTSALCSLLAMALSFVPPKTLKKAFPPAVTGGVILLIGASLIGESGFLNWGGGSGTCHSRPETGFFALCPDISAKRAYQWGDARFLGLGLLSFMTIIFLEFFGSPAMKSSSIVLGLVVGCIVAGPLDYIEGSSITSAPVATFLWRQTFPLKVHGPSVLPMLAVYLSLVLEAIGDITASSEASRQPVVGPLFESRIQGGVLADGFNGMLSGLMMNPPMSIFAQNNGVISITRCANRTAGYFCAVTLVVIGILAKISGVFLAIPNSVLGGVTTFLFASVVASGLKVLSLVEFTRRNRMILAASLSLGLGNLLVPDWSSYIFSATRTVSPGLRGFENSLIIVLSTPFLISGLVAAILNALLPADPDTVNEQFDEEEEDDEDSLETGHQGRKKMEVSEVKQVGAGESDDGIKQA